MYQSDFAPGSVEATVEWSIRNYPSLFANRTQVLHHKFVVLGSGNEWYRGGLVDVGSNRERRADEVLATYDGAYDHLGEIGDAIRRDVEARNEVTLQRRRAAHVLALTPGPLTHVYQPCQNSPFFTMPDDATEEWARAREEIAAVVEPLWYTGEHHWAHRHRLEVVSIERSSTPTRFHALLESAGPTLSEDCHV